MYSSVPFLMASHDMSQVLKYLDLRIMPSATCYAYVLPQIICSVLTANQRSNCSSDGQIFTTKYTLNVKQQREIFNLLNSTNNLFVTTQTNIRNQPMHNLFLLAVYCTIYLTSTCFKRNHSDCRTFLWIQHSMLLRQVASSLNVFCFVCLHL